MRESLIAPAIFFCDCPNRFDEKDLETTKDGRRSRSASDEVAIDFLNRAK